VKWFEAAGSVAGRDWMLVVS